MSQRQRSTGGRLLDLLLGGLSHQIEHHLFLSMPSVSMPAASEMIRFRCRNLDIPYLEGSVAGALSDVVRAVNRLGIRHADPFDCPAAAARRLA